MELTFLAFKGLRSIKIGVPLKHKKKASAVLKPCNICVPFAERRGFEPLKHFWRLLTFQASQFNHSCTSPFWCDKGNYFFDKSCALPKNMAFISLF